MRPIAVLLALLAVLVAGSAGAGGAPRSPGGEATARAVKIALPGQADVLSATAGAPSGSSPVAGSRFSYPADGSIVAVQWAGASATTTIGTNAAAVAESDLTGLSLFNGEITADAITGRATAGTGSAAAGGNFLRSAIVNLQVAGQPVALQAAAQRVDLGSWGYLTIGGETVDRSAPAGVHGYRGALVELDLHVTVAHGGLPAGSEIQLGYAEVAAHTAPPAPASQAPPAAPAGGPSVGDRPQLRPPSTPAPLVPRAVHPKLTAGRYVFPVYGPSSYADTFGAHRADESYHHGDDIVGQLGQPLVACADGTIYSVGWTKIGGNRLWLRDQAGNEFYYAHLSAFSTLVAEGAHVRAGQVIGFMGNTGDAEGGAYHLHFEVHPVSLLYLGYEGAVDPTPYLRAWQHARDLPFPVAAGWAPAVAGRGTAPEPGAILIGMSDISSASGLDPASLRRALRPPKQLVQTLIPAAGPSAGTTTGP